MIKIWRSWKSAFGEFSREFIPEKEESWNVTDIYTDGELERIRRAGFNAVWVHAQLNHIVRTGIFPELGEYAVEFRKRLNILTERAARHGMESVSIFTCRCRAVCRRDTRSGKNIRNAPECRISTPTSTEILWL